MPELPEVQTIVDDLNKKIIGREIVGVWFDAPKLITLRMPQGYGEPSRTIKKPKAKKLEGQIKGLKIISVSRRGKNILIYLTNNQPRIVDSPAGESLRGTQSTTNNYLLLIHQKMTGHFLYGKWRIARVVGRSPRGSFGEAGKSSVVSLVKGPLEEKVNNYIHLIFYFDNGQQLALSDLRKFAKVIFGPKKEIENLPDFKKIGPEPLEKNFKVGKFISLISSEKRKIKQVLMDQEVIAGIGNIYSDEILWLSKIHPLKPANQLKADELKRLYSAMKKILKKAIKLRGTSISDFRDTSGKAGAYARERFVYRKEGEHCPRCKGIIKRIKIKNRSAHYCPKCQK